MSNILEPTEAEMLPEDRNDFYMTISRVRRLNDEANAIARLKKLDESENPPWRTEPTDDEIRTAMHQHGYSFSDAVKILSEELVADAARLNAASPIAYEEIANLSREASEKKAEFDQLLQARQAALDDLESRIYALGKVRRQIRLVQSLSLDKSAEKKLANSALDFFLKNQGAGRSPANQSGWETSLKNLVYLSALTPFIPDYIAPLETKVLDIIKEIRALATTEKIDLRNFLALLKSERPAEDLGDCYEGLV